MTRMKKSKQINYTLNSITKMPPTKGLAPENPDFDPMHNDVVEWLIQQPDVRMFIFNRIRCVDPNNPLIKYDERARMWVGTEYWNQFDDPGQARENFLKEKSRLGHIERLRNIEPFRYEDYE